MGAGMASQTPRTYFAGGFLMLVGFLAGSVIGILKDEPSLGAILGTAAGAALALLLWVAARSRRAR